MYCSNCGNKVHRNIRLCPVCGKHDFVDQPPPRPAAAAIVTGPAVPQALPSPTKAAGVKYCSNCGLEAMAAMKICPTCKSRAFDSQPPPVVPPVKPRRRNSWKTLVYSAAVCIPIVVLASAVYFYFPKVGDAERWKALAEGHQHFEAGRYADAVATYQSVVDRFGDFKEGYASLGHALVGAVKHREAIDAYSKAIRLDPKYAGAYLGRGWIRWFLGDLEGAAQDYRKTVELDPDNVLFYEELERVLYELKRPKEVVKLWYSAAQRNPEWVDTALFKRVAALERVEAWETLRMEVPTLLAREELGKSAYLHFLLGRALNEARAHSEATQHLQRAVALAENSDKQNLERYSEELMYTYLWSGNGERAEQWRRELARKQGQ